MARRDDPRNAGGATRPAAPPGRWARVDRRGAAAAAGAAVFLLALFSYSGPSWPLVLYQLAADGALVFAWLLAAVGFGSAALRASRLRDSDDARPLLALVTAAAMGLGILSLAVLGLGLLGVLSRGLAVGVVGAGILLAALEAVRFSRRHGRGHADAALRGWLSARAGWGWLWLTALPPLALVVVGATLPPGFLWHPDEPHPYDVVEYHFQVPREWYEAGRIVPLRHNVFSFFPFDVEMHYLLAMHLRGGPWRGMYLAQLMHAAHVVLAVLAVYGTARRVAPSAAGATFAGVLAASVPWLALLAPVGYNEGGLLLYGTLAVGGCLVTSEDATHVRLRRFLLAGVMAGFACGAKLTAVPLVLLGVPAAALVEAAFSRGVAFRPAVAAAVGFVLAGAVVFSPWLVRNTLWAGNPVFPEAIPLLGRGHFTEAQAERWHRANHSPGQGQSAPAARLAAFGRQVWGDWRFGFVLLPLALLSIPAALRQGGGSWLLLIMLAGLSVFWVSLTHLQGRFFTLAIPIAALLVARVNWRRWTPAVAAVVVVTALAGWGMVHQEFAARMYGERQWVTTVGAAGEKLFPQLWPPELNLMPPDATLTLVGEARAFWYPRPMQTLRYRTVFDVDVPPGGKVIDAWRGRPLPGEWLLIDPGELTRFSKTYSGIPQPPPDVAAATLPYVVPAAATATPSSDSPGR